MTEETNKNLKVLDPKDVVTISQENDGDSNIENKKPYIVYLDEEKVEKLEIEKSEETVKKSLVLGSSIVLFLCFIIFCIVIFYPFE